MDTINATKTGTPPYLYRSKYGGLWVDRADAETVLARKLRDREIAPGDAGPLRHYIAHGYVVFPRAVSADLVDEYLACF